MVLIENGVLYKENATLATPKLLDMARTSGYIAAPEDRRFTREDFWSGFEEVTGVIAQNENAYLLKTAGECLF